MSILAIWLTSINVKSSIRTVANDMLDVSSPWGDQDDDARASFLAEVIFASDPLVIRTLSLFCKVCKQHPIFRSKFQDAWPVRIYTARFLEAKHRQTHHRSKDLQCSDFERGPMTIVQSYIPKPPHIDQLLDSTEQDFQEAMDFDHAQFRTMGVSSLFLEMWIFVRHPFSASPSETYEEVPRYQ